MLSKSSVFMMLLVVAAALVGMSIYQLPGAGTQPQQELQSSVLTQQDRELADRLLPYIIQRIDGQTILQKIDAEC
jgi:hypothetical protein